MKKKIAERFVTALGGIGEIVFKLLFFILTVFISILPLLVLPISIWFVFILIVIENLFPPISAVFWIWGLIVVINQSQYWFSVVYYIAFAIIFIPFFISGILDVINIIRLKKLERDKS